MAPRRPSNNRKRETRMHAALDAMSPYGFPSKLVRSTVHSLLKVYGGTEGWIFIEEGSYSLLIDTLLEKNQADDSEQDDMMDDNPGGDDYTGASASSSSNITLVPCINTRTSYDASPTNQAADTVSASSQTGVQVFPKAVHSVSGTNEIGNQFLILAMDSISATNESDNQLAIKTEDSVSAINETRTRLPLKIEPDAPAAASEPGNQLATTSNDPGNQLAIKAQSTVLAYNKYDCTPAYSPRTNALQPVSSHRPCYGWISDDDDEEEELLALPPAPLSQDLAILGNDGAN